MSAARLSTLAGDVTTLRRFFVAWTTGVLEALPPLVDLAEGGFVAYEPRRPRCVRPGAAQPRCRLPGRE